MQTPAPICPRCATPCHPAANSIDPIICPGCHLVMATPSIPFWRGRHVAAILVTSLLAGSMIVGLLQGLPTRQHPVSPAPVASTVPGEPPPPTSQPPENPHRERQQRHLTRLLLEGQERLHAHDHHGALVCFEQALALSPDDPFAQRGLQEARSPRRSIAPPVIVQQPAPPTPTPPVNGPAKPVRDMEQRFQREMLRGREALEAGQLAEAVRAFAAALDLQPENLEAQQGRKQAEARLAALDDRRKRRQTFENLLDQGRKSLTDRRFKEALASLEPAVRLFPDDRDGQRLLRNAREGLRLAKQTNAQRFLQIEEAIRAGRLQEAEQLADAARRDWPEDMQAHQTVQRVALHVDRARNAPLAYAQFVQQGTLAMAGQRYVEAVNAFTAALQVAPLDLDVQRNLRMARAALERDLRTRGDYERLYRAGNVALLRRAYPDAIRLYSEALKLVPDDLPAIENLRKARYGQAMIRGEQALRSRNKSEAITAFRSALSEQPNDPIALQALRQAQLLR